MVNNYICLHLPIILVSFNCILILDFFFLGNFTDNTWLSECVDLSSTFEILDGDSFHSSSSKHDLFPSSPDSGIGSPSSNNGDIVSPGSLSSECDSPINSPIQQDVLTVSEEDLEYLNGLWKAEDIFPLEIAATNDVTSPPDPITYTPHTTATVPALTENSLLGVTFTLVPCPEDLALPVLPKPSTTPPRKMKSLSTKEKKERKRAQNKSAATRYREKKRSEFQTVDAQMKTQEEKNRSLKDKVNQITREMQYLKDLLIEVYRTKGIIK